MIYFLQPIGGGPVKIGHSGDVETRRKSLESHYGQPLALLGVMPGDREEERAIHQRFSHLRFGRTEQFAPARELMDFIGRPLLVSPNPDAVEPMEPVSDVRSIVSLKGEPALADWLEKLMRHTESGSVANTLRRALKHWAVAQNFAEPMPER